MPLVHLATADLVDTQYPSPGCRHPSLKFEIRNQPMPPKFASPYNILTASLLASNWDNIAKPGGLFDGGWLPSKLSNEEHGHAVILSHGALTQLQCRHNLLDGFGFDEARLIWTNRTCGRRDGSSPPHPFGSDKGSNYH
jgi:hypothetical protein